MSENQNRGINAFVKFDSMTTEELEEILRSDADMPEGQTSDTDTIIYVMEVLAKRKRNSDNPGKTAQEAWESFQDNYLPQEDAYTKNQKQSKKHTHPRLCRLIAAAAVIAVLTAIPLTVGAFNWEDVWNAVAKWAQETFSFVSGPDTQIQNPTPNHTGQISSLQQALAEAKQNTDIVPTWIPERYQQAEIIVDETPIQKSFLAIYTAAEEDLKISIRSYIEADPEKIEVHEEVLEIYEVSGVKYYIFQNNEQLRAAWVKDSHECYISGDLTINEIKTMIDSIGKG